jgi:putative transposase
MNRADRLALVDHDDPALPVTAQCRLLQVARSTLYYQPVPAGADELAVMRRIDELHLEYPFYGSRRMAVVLRDDGWAVNRKRAQRLMRLMGLEAIYQKPNTSRPHPDHKVYPYLLRGLIIDRPNQVWCADITYIPMAKGFVYLVAVMDWFSRRVLAWPSGNFQHRPGRAVHQRRVPGRAFRPGCEDQHGRKREISGQHLHRTAMAQPEI